MFVLYRDIRTYGQREELYREARRHGVIFIRYSLGQKPRVQRSGEEISVVVRDHVLGRDIVIHLRRQPHHLNLARKEIWETTSALTI